MWRYTASWIKLFIFQLFNHIASWYNVLFSEFYIFFYVFTLNNYLLLGHKTFLFDISPWRIQKMLNPVALIIKDVSSRVCQYIYFWNKLWKSKRGTHKKCPYLNMCELLMSWNPECKIAWHQHFYIQTIFERVKSFDVGATWISDFKERFCL